jgi:hypothetical protein
MKWDKNVGCAMLTIRKIIILGVFFTTMLGCVVDRAPHIVYQKLIKINRNSNQSSSSPWMLDSLNPKEMTVLPKGRIIPISIYMEASGQSIYKLQFSANGCRLNPFILDMVQGSGEIAFSGRICWYVKVKGRLEVISVALYRTEKSKTGDTEVTTLLKEFRRKYSIADRHQKI